MILPLPLPTVFKLIFVPLFWAQTSVRLLVLDQESRLKVDVLNFRC